MSAGRLFLLFLPATEALTSTVAGFAARGESTVQLELELQFTEAAPAFPKMKAVPEMPGAKPEPVIVTAPRPRRRRPRGSRR